MGRVKALFRSGGGIISPGGGMGNCRQEESGLAITLGFYIIDDNNILGF